MALETLAFHSDHLREYRLCGECHLVFVPHEFHLSADAEKAEYDLHQNSPSDAGYRRFLSRLCDPLLDRIASNSCGLDFGSGPGPTLSVMLEEAGHRMEIYDPYFAPEESVLARTYDFVTASEVIEHFRKTRQDLLRIWDCVRPGGWLGMMTKLARDRAAFSRWHYKDDPTHVCFFSRETFDWLANKWNAEINFVGNDVILFRRATSAHFKTRF